MKNTLRPRFALSLLAGLLLVGGTHPTHAQQANKKTPNLAENKPEALGFSSERLERLHATMQRRWTRSSLRRRNHSGASRESGRGENLRQERHRERRSDDQGYDLPHLSMTKPVTGVAMMILFEEGKWHPSDPVSKVHPGVRPFESF